MRLERDKCGFLMEAASRWRQLRGGSGCGGGGAGHGGSGGAGEAARAEHKGAMAATVLHDGAVVRQAALVAAFLRR